MTSKATSFRETLIEKVKFVIITPKI